MTKIIEFPFAKLEICEHFFIGTFKDGILVDQTISDIVTETVLKEVKSKPFVYLSNRINSYAVDPSIYPSMSKIKNMVGFGVISDCETSLRNAEFEKFFYKKPFGIFDSLNNAKDWTSSIIKDFNEKITS